MKHSWNWKRSVLQPGLLRGPKDLLAGQWILPYSPSQEPSMLLSVRCGLDEKHIGLLLGSGTRFVVRLNINVPQLMRLSARCIHIDTGRPGHLRYLLCSDYVGLDLHARSLATILQQMDQVCCCGRRAFTGCTATNSVWRDAIWC